MANKTKRETTGYLHGFTHEEQDRLYHQARFLEHRVHEGLPFRRSRRMLEIGCGVGAQTDILLRRFPDLHITGVDASGTNLERASKHLHGLPWAKRRWELHVGDAVECVDQVVAEVHGAQDQVEAQALRWRLEGG